MRLEGVLAPVVTPFDPAGQLDLTGFRRNLQSHLAAGLHGVVVTGSTGEAALLDEAERAQVIEAARDVVPAGRPLIAGIGGESTRGVIARARTAASLGADAVLVVAPHYYGDAMTPEALRAHYERVADASPVPVLLYTIPKYMHFALAPALVHELSRHANIVGMKDSSGDATLFRQYMDARSEGFQVLTGSGTLLGQAMQMGADGAILAVALFAPVQASLVQAAVRDGDADALAGAQAHLTPLAAKIVAGLGVAGVKAALDAVGLAGGSPREPLRPLDLAARREVHALLEHADLLAAMR